MTPVDPLVAVSEHPDSNNAQYSTCIQFRNTSKVANLWGLTFNGEDARPLSREEDLYREQIRTQKMPQRRSDQLLDHLDTSKPFHSRLEFIELLAALSAKYKDEVSRKVTGANKEVKLILWSQLALSAHLVLFVSYKSSPDRT
jgi:hypothetical protein